MKKSNIYKLGMSLLLSLAVANSATAANQKVYAVVNGDNITQQSIAVALKDPKVQFEALPKETQKTVLAKIVEQKLLAQHAITTDVVNDTIYKSTLKSLQQDLALQVWMQKQSKEIKISNDEIKAFYNKNTKLFKVPEQFKAKHILLTTKKDAQNIINTLNKAKDLKAKFSQLAKSKSTGPSGKNGGDLGWFTYERMVPEFSKATKKLKIGSITKSPIKTQFGFHVIYLEDKKKPSTATLEQTTFQIRQEIGKKKFISHIQKIADGLKQKAKIEYK